MQHEPSRDIFINHPFDAAYKPLFDAIASGIDIHAHGATVSGAITATSDFLAGQVNRVLPGALAIRSALETSEAALPAIAAVARQTPEEITSIDRVQHAIDFLKGLR